MEIKCPNCGYPRLEAECDKADPTVGVMSDVWYVENACPSCGWEHDTDDARANAMVDEAAVDEIYQAEMDEAEEQAAEDAWKDSW